MERKDVPEKYKWHVGDILPDDEAWEKAYAQLEGKIDFARFKGTLNTAENILAYFQAEEAFEHEFMRVYLYAFLKHDEDVRVTKYGSYIAKVMSIITRLGQETAFATPELTALADETLRALAEDVRLKDYDYMLRRLIAQKKYILSEAEERILAQAGEPLDVANDVFEMLDNAELDLPEIEFEGEKAKLSHGLYGVIMNGSDREKRKEAYEKYYAAYRKIIGTLATTYYGNVKADIFRTNVRGYKSCLDRALFEEDVDRSVYENLVRCVNGAAPLMHRYMRLRKRLRPRSG